MLTFRAE